MSVFVSEIKFYFSISTFHIAENAIFVVFTGIIKGKWLQRKNILTLQKRIPVADKIEKSFETIVLWSVCCYPQIIYPVRQILRILWY